MKITFRRAPICLALLTSAVAWGQTTPSGAIPKTYFGMHTMNPSHWPTIPFADLGKAAGVAWPFVETSRGQYDWTLLDQYVDLAVSNGTSFIYSTQDVPKWAASDQSSCSMGWWDTYVCSSSITNIQDWKNFVTALVTRYKGKISIYELWNEPQTHFTGTTAQLVSLTNAEHDIIRSIDPSATILSFSMIGYGATYTDQYYAAGGTRDTDVLSVHLYPNPNNDVAEFLEGSALKSFFPVFSKYGLSSKPIWDTESSWGQTNYGAITDDNLREAFIAKNYLLHWAIGVTRVYWYAWDNDIVGTLWQPSTGLQPAGSAYEEIYNWIEGATMSGCSLNGSTSQYHALYTCDLKRSGSYEARAVWYTDGSKTYTVPGQFTQYRDLAGNVHPIPSNRQVTVGYKPILLEN